MGRQIGFYMSPLDLRHFVDALAKMGNIGAVTIPTSAVARTPLSDFARPCPGTKLFLFDIRDEKMLDERAHFQQISDSDIDNLPLVEFWQSKLGDRSIYPGRLYYIPAYFDAVYQRVDKPERFIKFANKLFRVVKKICPERRHISYAGTDALRLETEGYKLHPNG